MGTPYTQGIWQVKAGRADEFVAGWIEFSEPATLELVAEGAWSSQVACR